jgi:hypothetical protein
MQATIHIEPVEILIQAVKTRGCVFVSEEKRGYYTSRADVVSARVNPWAGELVHTIKKGRKVTGFSRTTRHSLVDHTTGEISDDIAVLGVQKVVDKEEFIKFFGAGIMEVFELTKPAKDVFKAIMNVYLEQKNKPDQLYFNHEMVRLYFGFDKSRTSFNNGINELCVKGFIAPVEAMDSLYWVNPNLFYKGDRIRIVHEYVRAGTKAAKQVELENAKANQGALALDDPNREDE